MLKLVLLYLLLVVVSTLIVAFVNLRFQGNDAKPIQQIVNILPSPTPEITLLEPPQSKILPGTYHIFQTFNNCGPAALSMMLSYFEIVENQQKLGADLRPFQNAAGDNDDKSVTLEELAEKSQEYNLVPYHRPNGDIDLIKLFITYDIPVIARTLLFENEDIGHYRVVKGFDDATGQLIQDDSMQGRNLRFSYQNFYSLWEKFNYEYLVLVPQDKVGIAEAILGEDVDEKTAWQKAVLNAENELKTNPDDIYARFNLSVALFNTEDYERSTQEFEKVEGRLPFRTLWYQIEPIQAYFKLGNYERVFAITDKVLNNYNRAFSELYIIRGQVHLKQGNIEVARQEFEKAVFFNVNLKSTQEALNSLKN